MQQPQQEIENAKHGDDEQEFVHTSPFRTKGGWPARLVGVLQRRAFPLVVAVWNPAFKAEELHSYDLDGKQPMRAVYATGDVAEGHDGARDGALSLVNIDKWDEEGNIYMKPTEFVHAVAFDLEPMDIERSANPFHYDMWSMGTDLVCGWTVMHQGYDNKENPQCLTHVDLVNGRSGQRIRVSLMQPKAKA